MKIFTVFLICFSLYLTLARNPNALFPQVSFDLYKIQKEDPTQQDLPDYFDEEEIDTHWYSPYFTYVKLGSQFFPFTLNLHSQQSLIFQNQTSAFNTLQSIDCIIQRDCFTESGNVTKPLVLPFTKSKNISKGIVDLNIFNQRISIEAAISAHNQLDNQTQYLKFLQGSLGIAPGSSLFDKLGSDFGFSIYIDSLTKKGKFIIGQDESKRQKKGQKLELENDLSIFLSERPLQASQRPHIDEQSSFVDLDTDRKAIFDMAIDAIAIPQNDYNIFMEELLENEIECFPQLNSPYQECIILENSDDIDELYGEYDPLSELPEFSFFTEKNDQIKLPPQLYLQPIDEERLIYQLIVAPTITFAEREFLKSKPHYEYLFEYPQSQAKDKIPVNDGYENYFILGSYFMDYYYTYFRFEKEDDEYGGQSLQATVTLWKAAKKQLNGSGQADITIIYVTIICISSILIIAVQSLAALERKKGRKGSILPVHDSTVNGQGEKQKQGQNDQDLRIDQQLFFSKKMSNDELLLRNFVRQSSMKTD